MELIPVDSSFIEAFGYDVIQETLHIKFKGKEEVSKKNGVPIEVYELLMAAESKGSFYTRNIKNNYSNPLTDSEQDGT